MDPLTAVVLLAIAGAAAAVAILQVDQDATASIELPIDEFAAGEFPGVCCKTGQPSEVKVSVEQRRWFRSIVEGSIPVSKARLIEFTGWRDLYRRTATLFVPLAVVGIGIRLAAGSVLVSWAVDLSLLAVVFVAVYSRAKARRLLVSPKRTINGNVTLRGLHPAFVDAVQSGRSGRRPAS